MIGIIGRGAIGMSLARYFNSLSQKIDIGSRFDASRIIANSDVIFFTSARSGGFACDGVSFSDILRDNVWLPYSCAELTERLKNKLFIFPSSMSIYKQKIAHDGGIAAASEDSEKFPHGDYAASKMLAESVLMPFGCTRIIRIPTFIGDRQLPRSFYQKSGEYTEVEDVMITTCDSPTLAKYLNHAHHLLLEGNRNYVPKVLNIGDRQVWLPFLVREAGHEDFNITPRNTLGLNPVSPLDYSKFLDFMSPNLEETS